MRFRLVLLLLCCACPTPGSHVWARTSPAPELVQRMLEGQRISAELAAIRQRAVAELSAQQGRVRAVDRSRLEAVVRIGFDPDALLRRVREELLAEIDLAHAREAAAWLAEPAHRALYARGLHATERCLADLPLEALTASATPTRDPHVMGVARGTGAAGRSVRQGSLVFAAMLIAGNGALPAERRFSAEQVQLLIESQRAALADRHPTDLRALHCAFRDVPTRDLARGAAFFATPAGRWLRSSTDRAVERALVQAATDTARYIVESFGHAPPAAPLHAAMR